MNFRLRSALVLTGLLCLCVRPAAAYQLETVAEGLDFPWCIAFLPSGDLLVTELGGQLRIIRDGALDPVPVVGVPAVYRNSQGGLFDVLLHPEFGDNGVVYLSYAAGEPGANATRVARARFTGRALEDLAVIFEVRPTKNTPVHYGGRMAFLPDGTLLVTTGDGFDFREQAQKLDSLLGKTIRLHEDGSIPADNPFVGDAAAFDEIWSYGHRNPQGLTVDPATGRVYLHEHGPRGGDELNLIERGANYGWPVITYGMDYSGAYVSPYTAMPGMTQPLVYWVPSIAPAGLAYYSGEKFPAWRGDLFVAALVERSVRRIDLDANGNVLSQEKLFTELNARLRDVRSSPDGYLYILTDGSNGKVVRVVP
jgi:glucose/arabinose dehydrogenase